MTDQHATYAAMVVRFPGEVELATLERSALAGKAVRVAVEAVGVNPVDAGNRADGTWAGLDAPYVVGYEFAGRVLAIGRAVSDLEPGDDVWGLLPVRGTRWGAYAEEVVADAAFVAHRPPALSALEAAALPLAGGTALQILERLQPQAGEWMLVHGAGGGVGHLLVHLAHDLGVQIAAPASAARRMFLESLGVGAVVDRAQPEPLRAARERVGADFPLVADLVGGGLLAASLPLMAEGGRAAAIVDLAGDLDEALDRNITVHGVLLRPGRELLGSLGRLVERGVLRPTLDEVLPLTEAARALRRVASGSGRGKVVLRVPSATRSSRGA
jgi:NADPH2:quinone reductase